jgi:Tfp pilus assembly protein PilO
MKKNVIIALLAVVSVLSLSYGFYQKQEADKFELMAQENERVASEMRTVAEHQQKLAEQQRMIAEVNMVEAIRQRQIAEERLNKK